MTMATQCWFTALRFAYIKFDRHSEPFTILSPKYKEKKIAKNEMKAAAVFLFSTKREHTQN